MNKFKNGLKNILSYIAARRLLRYSIIFVVIILLPTGVILTNKYFNNKVNNIENNTTENTTNNTNTTNNNTNTNHNETNTTPDEDETDDGP